MSKRSNTFPYTNARRAGRTSPGLIEMRDSNASALETVTSLRDRLLSTVRKAGAL